MLSQSRVNGRRALLGVSKKRFLCPAVLLNPIRQVNANEGALIIPHTIVTQDDLIAWINDYFFNLSGQNITALLAAYSSSSSPVNASDARYETDGYGPGTAVNISQAATGQQQRAYVSLLNTPEARVLTLG